MKTPDKIKKGLECCNGKWVGTHFRGCDSECPYYSEQPFCKNVRNHDTLAYIQQLERERDALLKALKCTDIDCGHCKHCNTMEDVCQCDCSDCELDADKCTCNKCRNNSHWEWAGIKEDNP